MSATPFSGAGEASGVNVSFTGSPPVRSGRKHISKGGVRVRSPRMGRRPAYCLAGLPFALAALMFPLAAHAQQPPLAVPAPEAPSVPAPAVEAPSVETLP